MKKQNKDILRKKGLELMNLWRADWNRFVREALGVTLDKEQQEILSIQQANIGCIGYSPWKRLRGGLCRYLFLVSHTSLEKEQFGRN